MATEVMRLCRRARQGDHTAASELLEMFHQRIFSYLRRLCGNNEDAEDLTQETFVKAWSSISGFRGRSSFSSWIHSIAYHAFIDWTRKKNRTSIQPSDWWEECADQGPSPFDNAVERQTAERLYQAVERLDEAKQHVVHLHYYQGLSLRETALALCISASTVKYRLRGALAFLRSEMGKAENQPSLL